MKQIANQPLKKGLQLNDTEFKRLIDFFSVLIQIDRRINTTNKKEKMA